MTINVALAGAGAFGIKHLDGIRNIADVKVVSLIGREYDKTKEVADKYGIAHVSTELADALAIREVDAVILCTLSLSFNNDGPLGTFFRYIGDTGTYIARYDDLFNGKEEKIDVSQVAVSMNGIELQDREFFAAIREGREPNASVAQVLPCYEVLHQLEQQLN